MKKKIFLGFIGLMFLGLLSYLFLWPSDLQVTFKTKGTPGTINQAIKLWVNSLDNSNFTSQTDLRNFSHQIQFNDSIYSYDWKVKALTDSSSQVKVFVTDLNNSIENRIAVPFTETNFEKRTKRTLLELAKTLKDHTDSFKVTIEGVDQMAAKYCAYVPLKSTQTEKALKMMKDFPFLNSVLSKNKVQLDGAPFIEVTKWNIQKDSIQFNFCYPIIKSDTLPNIKGVFYKPLEEKKALKAVYNGNYMTSDRAWYSLINYAEKNDFEIEQKPLEVFYSNPNMGGDELTWKAEIFMPLKK